MKENDIIEKQDKSEEDYVDRITKLMAAGTSSRRRLRSSKALGEEENAFFTGTKIDIDEVSKEARLYYRTKTGKKEKRPTKILDHKDFNTLGRHYLLLWHDVGYADQDIEEWYPANYAKTFEGLVEDYCKVSMPH